MDGMGAAPRVVVLGWGNETRADDGLGPALTAQIEAAGWPHVTVIEDFQLQIEHALDLVGADLVLFVDAGFETPAPFFFAETAPRGGMTHSSHGLQPEAVLAVYQQVRGDPPPPAFVLCIRGEDFSLAEGLTPEAEARLADAWAHVVPLLTAPSLSGWRAAQVGQAPDRAPPVPGLTVT